MKNWAAGSLTALLFWSIAILWVPGRWGWCVFQVGVFGLAILFLGMAASHRIEVNWNLSLLPLLGVIAWGALQISGGHTIYAWQTFVSLLDWATYAAVAFVGPQVFGEPRRRRRFLEATAGFALLLSALSITQMFTANGRIYWMFASGYNDFVLGPFISRNQYSAFVELLLPVVLWLGIGKQRKWLYWMTAGVMFGSVIAAASRAGTVLVVIEIPVFFGVAMARKEISAREAALVALKLIVPIVALTAIAGAAVVWDRLQTPDNFAERREILRSTIDMVRERPLWGFGLGTWATAYPRFAYFDDGSFVNQAHNDWAQWAAEGGIPMLALLILFAAIAARPAIRSLWGLGIFFIMAHALVDYPFQQRPAPAAWFFLMAAIVTQSGREAHPNHPVERVRTRAPESSVSAAAP